MATTIGVYFDQSAVAGSGLDLEELAAAVETKWADSCPVVRVFPIMADQQARDVIAADIAEHELDGILLCGSSARFDWDLYRFTKVQTERVSLREGCVLAYKNPDGSAAQADEAPELLTLMATDYVNMGVVKLQKSTPPVGQAVESTRHVLVLGGGWAGLTAAKAAADAGFAVTIVEKDKQLGGKAAGFVKTFPMRATETAAHPTGLEEKIAGITAHPHITVCLESTLTCLAGTPGTYTATIATPSGEISQATGAVVLATGWVPQQADVLAPLGYGSSPRIVTTAEFEAMSKAGTVTAQRVAFILNINTCDVFAKAAPCASGTAACQPEAQSGAEQATQEASDEDKPAPYADMESPRHLAYANAVNSMAALKQARYLTDADPDNIAYILYDSMVVQGIHERFYKAAQDTPGIMLTKADILSVKATDNGVSVVAGNTLLGNDITLEVDLVVLPTGMVPTTAKEAIMHFAYRQGPGFPDLELFDGFADSNYICFPYETRRTGVYAAGCVRQPMTLDGAEDDGYGAALKAIQCIESTNHGVAVHPRSGDLSYPIFNFVRCTQCKRCTEECPFGALDDDEKGTPLPNPSRCRRCGTCMGACPERVISFETYNIDQIGSMIREIHVPDDMNAGGPRVLILACENDALPAFDMAAMRRKPWNPYVRIIPVRCLGSVNAIWVADAMSKGIDGVMLMGCKYGDDYQCHFVKGSEICSRRKENIAETLNRLGVEPERVAQYEIAIDEYDRVPELVDDFMRMIFEKGPNPFKGY